MDEVRAPKSSLYFPALDTLRGVFAIATFGVHFSEALLFRGYPEIGNMIVSKYLGWLSFGVPFFFVLSAFLITLLLLKEKKTTGTVAVGSFYLRRILRVWPVYIVTVVVGVFVVYPHLNHTLAPGTLTAFCLFFANIYMTHCGPGMMPGMSIAPLWSVSVEEQFYAVWPWVSRCVKERHMLYVGIGLIVSALLVRDWRYDMGLNLHTSQWYYTFTHTDSFGCGVIAALAYRRGYATVLGKRLGWIAIGTLVFVFAVQYFTGTLISFPSFTRLGSVFYSLVPMAAAFLILAAAQPADTVSKGWKNPVGLWFGRISFGFYAYHGWSVELFLNDMEHDLNRFWLRTLGAFVFTLVAASVSYVLMERPLLSLKSRFQVVPSGSSS